MAGAWQEHGRSMARAWQEHGSTAHAQYAWSAGCGIACLNHYILRSLKETTNFKTPGVAFGIMTVAAVPGFQIYKLKIALAQADREFSKSGGGFWYYGGRGGAWGTAGRDGAC